MAKKSSSSLGKLLVQIALGAMLIVGGIYAFTGGGDFGAEAFSKVFSGQALTIVKIIYGIIELIAGVFLILELFIGDRVGKIDNILNLIVIVIWIIAIILFDFIKADFNPFLGWLLKFATHVFFVGALLNLND